jgi:hypothetical protein
MKRLSLLITGILLFGFASLHSQIPDYVPKTGLIGWWPFNGNAQDESGNGNHGNVSGTILTLDRFGYSNKAYEFSKGSVVTLKNSASLNIVSALTMSVWIKPYNVARQPFSGIIQKSNSNNYAYGDYNVSISSQGVIVGYTKDDESVVSFTSPFKLLDNKWYHIVSTWNGNEQVIYVNSTPLLKTNFYGKLYNGNSNVFFGANLDGDDEFFEGIIDDIGIWNRALSQSEIESLYDHKGSIPNSNCTYFIKESDTTICPGTSLKLNAIQTSATKSVIPQDGLIGYWPFNGNANDESGNGNHGIVDGASITVDRCGKFNQAYLFNGVSSKITIKDNPILRPTSFTCAAWVYLEDDNNLNQILSKNAGDDNFESVDMVIHNGNGYNLLCNIGGPDYYGTWLTTPNKVQLNNWHLMTFIFDDLKDSIYSYIDEKLVAQSFETKSVTYDTLPWSIGSHRENGQWSWHFKGKIDDITIWNRPLTSSEISQVYNANSCNCEDTLTNDKFTWSNGQKGRTITVKPDTSTIYRLTVTDGLIIHQDSIRVTVGGDSCYSCTYAILEQDTTICQGTTLQLHSDLSDTINANIPKEGLIGYWPFNGNANDESGNGNHGIVNGADLTKGRNGKDNQAYAFDGVDDFIQTNNDSISSDGYAISAWFKTTNNAEGQGLVISRSQSQVDGLYLNKDRIVQCMSKCNKSFHLNEKTIQYNDDKWHHFVSVYDGKQMRGYIDGQLYSMQDQVGTICLNAPFEFGNDRPYARFYKGILDDIAIWNRPLSDSEVVSLFKLESVKVNTTIPQDGLVGYWPFNGNANDESGNGNHGIVNGAVLSTDRCSKNDFAFKFYRNESSFIQVTREKLDTFTFSMWFNVNSISSISPLIDAFKENWEVIINDNTLKFVQWFSYSNGNNSGYNYLGNSDKIKINEWYNFTGSYANKHLILYLDGKQIFSDTNVNLPLRDDGFFLFGESRSGSTQYFDGKLDDIAIWNRALSIMQVLVIASIHCQKISLSGQLVKKEEKLQYHLTHPRCIHWKLIEVR